MASDDHGLFTINRDIQFGTECYLFFNSLIIREKYLMKFTEPTKVKKCSRTLLEQACHYCLFNLVGKTWLPELKGL